MLQDEVISGYCQFFWLDLETFLPLEIVGPVLNTLGDFYIK